MSWADLQAMLADAADQPAILVVCALLVFVAGAFAGSQARRREIDPEADAATWCDAGETEVPEAHWRNPPLLLAEQRAPQTRQRHVPPYPLPAPAAAPHGERRKVRAGTCGPQLKPSFDSRRQSVDVPHHPV